MKILMEIPEHDYQVIQRHNEGISDLNLPTTILERLFEAIGKGKVIPDTATCGEVMEIIFDKDYPDIQDALEEIKEQSKFFFGRAGNFWDSKYKRPKAAGK